MEDMWRSRSRLFVFLPSSLYILRPSVLQRFALTFWSLVSACRDNSRRILKFWLQTVDVHTVTVCSTEPFCSDREVEQKQALWTFRVRDWTVLCQQSPGEGGRKKLWMEKDGGSTFSKEFKKKEKVKALAPGLVLMFVTSHFLLPCGCFCSLFRWGHSPLTTYFGSKTASGFHLRGLYWQKRMLLECLPVTYSPPSRACMCTAPVPVPNERLLARVFNKERGESTEGRGRWNNMLTCRSLFQSRSMTGQGDDRSVQDWSVVGSQSGMHHRLRTNHCVLAGVILKHIVSQGQCGTDRQRSGNPWTLGRGGAAPQLSSEDCWS